MTNINDMQTKFRVLHSAALLRPPSGICTQMDWEQEAADSLKIDWEVKMYCPDRTEGGYKVYHIDPTINIKQTTNIAGKIKNWVLLRRNYHVWLLNQQDKVDIFLLRYYVHDPFQYWFIKKCSKPVCFVHHTLEVEELALPGTLLSWVRSNLEKIIGKFAIAASDCVVGVTQEIVDYELSRSSNLKKPAYVYPNGVIYSDQEIVDRRCGDIPEILFVANFAPWHGLDRLLKEVERSDAQFVLHLVGRIPDELHPLVLDSRIKVHGALSHQEINELSQRCWIGLSSFGLDRNGMKQACPLKVREYLTLGLPVYGSYRDIFPLNFEFFGFGSPSLSEIVEFSRKMKKIPRDKVRAASKCFIDKSELLQNLYSSLNKFINV